MESCNQAMCKASVRRLSWLGFELLVDYDNCQQFTSCLTTRCTYTSENSVKLLDDA